MRATSENIQVASILGINVDTVILLTFAVASALAGIAGVLVGLNFNAISPFMGIDMGIKGMAVMLIGGLGSIYGAMMGGLILGIDRGAQRGLSRLSLSRCLRVRPDDPDPDRSPERPVPDRDHGRTLTMLGSYWESVAIFIGINCLMGISLYIPMMAGLISLGQGGFMAIGAYVCALLTKADVPFGLALCAGGCAAAVGRPGRRNARAANSRHLRDDLHARLWRNRSCVLCQL